MSLIVVVSTVADGSMYNRKDPIDLDVIENRKVYLAKQGIQFTDATRVHPNANQRAEVDHETNWCKYIKVDASSKLSGMKDGNTPAADALVTKTPGHALMLPIADCVGAVFYDVTTQTLGVAHLGRHSLEQQGGQQFVAYLQSEYGSDPSKIKVWLTPAPGKDIYPIWALENKGMKEVTFEQLLHAGILMENIIDMPIDTDKDLNYYSYSEYLKGHRDEDGDYAIVAMMTD